MAKNSTKQIIEDEKRILLELTVNANKSINEIAKTCGFSRQKVWRIIKTLERTKVIWGYTAVIDEEKQDMKGFTILIKRQKKPIDKQTIEKIALGDLSKKTDKIGATMLYSVYTNGPYDWMINFIAKDIKDAKRFEEIFLNLYEGYISEIILLENLFVSRKCGIMNPEAAKLKNFFS